MDQIFNELSANASYADKYAASAGMERMLRLSNSLYKCGFYRALRVAESFGQLPIAPDYSIVQWARDKSVGADKDLQRFLLTIAAKAPYVEQFVAEAEQNFLVEFYYANHPALGLGLAYLWDSTALSLDSDTQFLQPYIDVQMYQISDEKEISETVSVSSLSCEDQLEAVCRSLQQRQIAGVNSGKQLVEQFSQLFPTLVLGRDASKQLMGLSGSEQHYQEILRHCSVLHSTMQNWSNGKFDPQGITWSLESESTLNQFAAYRQFVCSDGEQRQFSLHTKIKSANQRIYFLPIVDERVVHIGYVGRHLPTTQFRT